MAQRPHPPFCSLTPLQDTAREAFASPLFPPGEEGGAAELPTCCVAALSQTQTSTSRAQPLPHPRISASSALSGVPGSPSPHTPPGSQGGPSFSWGRPEVGVPIPKARFFVIREEARSGQGLAPS